MSATPDSHFSWMRTRLSFERTLMSWIRTAVSLIGFGFTIVQVFERFQQAQGAPPPPFPEAPHYFGLALILAGVVALVVSTAQYRQGLRYLWSGPFAELAGTAEGSTNTPLIAVTIVLALVGIVAFLTILLRVA